VTQAAVAAQIHQSLDIHGDFPTEVTLDGHFSNLGTQVVELRLAEFTHFDALFHTTGTAKTLRLGTTHTKDVGKRDHGVLVVRYIDPGYTSHLLISEKLCIRADAGDLLRCWHENANPRKKARDFNDFFARTQCRQTLTLTLLVTRV
jgi:hypothetical protein